LDFLVECFHCFLDFCMTLSVFLSSLFRASLFDDLLGGFFDYFVTSFLFFLDNSFLDLLFNNFLLFFLGNCNFLFYFNFLVNVDLDRSFSDLGFCFIAVSFDFLSAFSSFAHIDNFGRNLVRGRSDFNTFLAAFGSSARAFLELFFLLLVPLE
jgi:hypothetical protein